MYVYINIWLTAVNEEISSKLFLKQRLMNVHIVQMDEENSKYMHCF